MLNKLKNSIYLLLLLLLNNCMTSGTALLGPIFTGAKTGSIYQASLSYGSGKIMRKINVSSIFDEEKLLIAKKNKVLIEIHSFDKEPIILTSYKIDKILYSEIIEPEPLP